MKQARIYRRSYRYYRQKDYHAAIRLLEPQLAQHLNDSFFLALLSHFYLLAGNLDNAELYSRRGLRNTPNNVHLRLLSAAIHLRHQESEKSLSIWLNILQSKHRQPQARYALRKLRKLHDQAMLIEFNKSKNFWRLLPQLPGLCAYRYRNLSLWLLCLGLLSLLGLAFYWQPRLFKIFPLEEPRDKLVLAQAPKTFHSNTIQTAALKESLKRIENYYQDYRDNAICYEMNLLRQQMLPANFENWLANLEVTLIVPQAYELLDNFSYEDVKRSPQLYQGCYVLWSGRVTNIRKTPEKMGFDLLVDYLDGSKLSGQVGVWYDTSLSIHANQAVKVFAQIKHKDSQLELEGLTLLAY